MEKDKAPKSEKIKQLVADVKGLSDEERESFEEDTFHDLAFSVGMDSGVQVSIKNQILDLVEQTGVHMWEELRDEVEAKLAGKCAKCGGVVADDESPIKLVNKN